MAIIPEETTGKVGLFTQFIQFHRQEGTSGQSISARYKPLLANLKKFRKPLDKDQIAREFVERFRLRQSPRIANQNLSLLKEFGTDAAQPTTGTQIISIILPS